MKDTLINHRTRYLILNKQLENTTDPLLIAMLEAEREYHKHAAAYYKAQLKCVTI